MIVRNPMDTLGKVKVEKVEREAISLERANRLLVAAEGDRHEAFWKVMLFCGMRPGEAQGLKWTDLEPDQGPGRITIQRALGWANNKEWYLGAPNQCE
jgi:integrase